MEVSFEVSDLHFSFDFVQEQARVPRLVAALGVRVSVSGCVSVRLFVPGSWALSRVPWAQRARPCGLLESPCAQDRQLCPRERSHPSPQQGPMLPEKGVQVCR